METSMLKGKCALVTGSTGGLGLAVIEALAREGCHVVLNGLAKPEDMKETLTSIEKRYGVKAVYHGTDLAQPDKIEDMMKAIAVQFGGVDILVNNAVVRHFSPVETFPVAKWNEALAVNLSSAFHTIRLALPHMRARNWGRIINMASIYSNIGAANRIDYVTTKTAMLGMTRAVAMEIVEANITCNAVCPGSVLTEANAARIDGMARTEGISSEAATKKFLEGKQPGGRFVEAASVAAMTVFLCTDAAKDINAASIPVDLGWIAS
jgi:3-hydroxybutyrate dehydrogenase